MSKRSVAVLVGNGLSIAFNPELNLQSITEEVLRRIEVADGGQVVAAMQEIAEHALHDGVTSDSDFERLVGAFGAEHRTLGYLGALAGLTSPMDGTLTTAISTVADFARDVRDAGVSHVLEVITERSHARRADMADLDELVSAVLDRFDGDVTFGNLNYDTLLLAALINAGRPFADLGDGGQAPIDVEFGDRTVSARPLRDSPRSMAYLDTARVCLLHLHGSLTYWGDERCAVKLQKSDLTESRVWEAVRDGETEVRPLVVLATPQEKPHHIVEHPFDLAYEAFARALSEAQAWIVIGYSFRDEPINAMLRKHIDEFDVPPDVLVVTHGDSPSRSEIEHALDWRAEDGDSAEWLMIERGGANGVQRSKQWTRFVAS